MTKTCPQCDVEIPAHQTTCGNSYCQEAEYHDNGARARGLKENGQPRKGWIWCTVHSCGTPVKLDGDGVCFGHGHRHVRRPYWLQGLAR